MHYDEIGNTGHWIMNMQYNSIGQYEEGNEIPNTDKCPELRDGLLIPCKAGVSAGLAIKGGWTKGIGTHDWYRARWCRIWRTSPFCKSISDIGWRCSAGQIAERLFSGRYKGSEGG